MYLNIMIPSAGTCNASGPAMRKSAATLTISPLRLDTLTVYSYYINVCTSLQHFTTTYKKYLQLLLLFSCTGQWGAIAYYCAL